MREAESLEVEPVSTEDTSIANESPEQLESSQPAEEVESAPRASTRKRKRRRRAAASMEVARELRLSASELGPDDRR